MTSGVTGCLLAPAPRQTGCVQLLRRHQAHADPPHLELQLELLCVAKEALLVPELPQLCYLSLQPPVLVLKLLQAKQVRAVSACWHDEHAAMLVCTQWHPTHAV